MEAISGILLIDKPLGFTSHDIVAKLRGILKERKIGHAGTLDPMASGLLLCLIRRGTRASQFAEKEEKSYVFSIRFGLETDSYDLAGEVIKEEKVSLSESEVKKTIEGFLGESEQTPPIFSAIKVDGKPLYKYARAGRNVEVKPRKIFINKIELLGKKDEDYKIRVSCSKGSYIRSLAMDIGRSLGTVATVTKLRRESIGKFSVKDAIDINEASKIGREALLKRILPVDTLFSEYPEVIL
ncbi:MAG: tRNA pseudouridine(55) synthase TruB, partial [Clostridiales bacterium]|nr:tRNA pseudouridine(55) synthase TruB [Clostridiales bacterium]